MDGAAAVGELSRDAHERRPIARSGRLRFELATAADDAEVRRVLRENPMAGDVQLAFEREPGAFIADAVEGDFHQTLVARDVAGRIVAMGRRSVRDAWVNGARARLGYLGQLRIDAGNRGRDTLVGGYQHLRELHGDGRAVFYLTSVMADNLPARRMLEAGVRGLPTYRRVGEWVTVAIPAVRSSKRRGLACAATDGDVEEIARCLEQNGKRFQFTPAWGAADVVGSARTPGLSVRDFSVVRAGGKVVGCGAVWDQRGFKQVVVRGYGGRLARWRSAINLAAPMLGWPRLPAVGQQMRQAYLSHLAVDGDDPAVFDELVAAATRGAARRGCEYLLAGLAVGHPLLDALRRWRYRAVRSVLYCVHWEDGREAVTALDGRMPHVEVATL